MIKGRKRVKKSGRRKGEERRGSEVGGRKWRGERRH
jgi:hypothetical protein